MWRGTSDAVHFNSATFVAASPHLPVWATSCFSLAWICKRSVAWKNFSSGTHLTGLRCPNNKHPSIENSFWFVLCCTESGEWAFVCGLKVFVMLSLGAVPGYDINLFWKLIGQVLSRFTVSIPYQSLAAIKFFAPGRSRFENLRIRFVNVTSSKKESIRYLPLHNFISMTSTYT